MTWYLQLNIALFAFGLLAVFSSHLNIRAVQKIKLHYLMILLALLVLPFMALVPEAGYDYPAKETLSAPLMAATDGVHLMHKNILASSIPKLIPYRFEYISYLVYLIIFAIACLIPWKTFVTYKAIKKAYLYKKVGSVSVLISDKLQSPYAFSFLNFSYVVVPQFLLSNPNQLSLAIKHEFQHIRNSDTAWIYLFEFILSVCFLNPVIYVWRKYLLLDQEFACDESLIAHKKVSPQAYATCLLEVADITNSHKIPYGATGMAWGGMQSQLSRRIEKMKYLKKDTKNIFSAIVGVSLLFFSLSVFALQKQTKTITMKELKRTVALKDFEGFPIEINKSVLAELNRFSSNSRWQKFAKESLERYEGYKGLISAAANKYNMPQELAAVAFIESGFKNLPDRSTSISTKGAGMWQFIPKTARHYGLDVNEKVDQRLDVELATDAAIRYLRDNKLQLADIKLALMGYYIGQNRVFNDIAKYGTRDPWLLIKKAEYKTPYLARVMAAVILMKYPEIIE